MILPVGTHVFRVQVVTQVVLKESHSLSFTVVKLHEAVKGSLFMFKNTITYIVLYCRQQL